MSEIDIIGGFPAKSDNCGGSVRSAARSVWGAWNCRYLYSW